MSATDADDDRLRAEIDRRIREADRVLEQCVKAGIDPVETLRRACQGRSS